MRDIKFGKEMTSRAYVKAFEIKRQRSVESTDRILTLILEHFMKLLRNRFSKKT